MDNYIGEIRAFAGNKVPLNWHICDGSMLRIQDYSELYAVIGPIYGGDGRTTFALPDLRGSLPISQGQGPDLTDRIAGQSGGSEEVTLSISELPAHNHSVQVSIDGTPVNTPGSKTTLSVMSSPSGIVKGYLPGDAPEKTVTAMNKNSISPPSDDGGLPHDNMMPSMAINYIIALKGIFPPRSN